MLGTLGTLVDYLHNARVPFRLASYPSEEDRPIAGHPLPPGGLLVDTRVLSIAGGGILAVFPDGEEPDLAAISTALGGVTVSATIEELPEDFRRAGEPVPPFGQLFGIPVVVDARVAAAAVLVFRAFGESTYFDVVNDDWARLEQPRVASFSSAGELKPGPRPTQPSFHR